MKSLSKLIIILLLFLIIFCPQTKGEKIYRIIRNNNKITIKFNDSWRFKKISIPVCSNKIWGDDKTHNVAILEFNNEKHILSSKQGETYLQYLEETKVINSFTLTSINTSFEKIAESLPKFEATISKTKEIEDELLLMSNKEISNIKKNKCFSCHTLIPVALTLKTAKSKGFNIENSKVEELFDSISEVQKDNGSFFFESQPIYGVRTTTLSCSYIISLLADFSPQKFLKIGEKISDYFVVTHKSDGIIQPDFIFKPFFNEVTTSILFEIIFRKTLYLNQRNNEEANKKSNYLLNLAVQYKNIDFINKLILLTGIPYSYQFKPGERARILEELKQNFVLPKGQLTAKLRILILYTFNRIAPDDSLPPMMSFDKLKNNELFIWNCLEKVLYNSPNYLNGSYDEN